MRPLRASTPIALALLIAACGSSDKATDTTEDAGAPHETLQDVGQAEPGQTEPASTTDTSSAEPDSDAPESEPSADNTETTTSPEDSTSQQNTRPTASSAQADASAPAVTQPLEPGTETDPSTAESSTTEPSAEAGVAPEPTFAISWLDSDTLIDGVPLEYGALDVPLDYSKPAGETLQLALARSRTASSKRAGVLMFNPGGPGVPVVESAEGMLSFLRSIFPTFDVVLMDNRGTGFSSPLSCISVAERDAAMAAAADILPDLRSQAEADGEIDELDEATLQMADRIFLLSTLKEGCLALYPTQLAYFDTENVARDMDSVRAGLDEEKLNFWGVSYGTVQGSLYAQMYPERVRAFALDSVVLRTDAGPHLAQDVITTTGVYEDQLNRFLQWAELDDQSALYDHPAGAPDVIFDALMVQLDAGVEWNDKQLDTDLLANTAIGFLMEGNWPSLAIAIGDAAEGDWEAAVQTAQSNSVGEDEESDWVGQQANGIIRMLDEGCPADYTPETAAIAHVAVFEQYPRMAAGLADLLADCAVWPIERAEARIVAKDVQSPPLLFLNGLNDPATPYADAVQMVEQLNNGSRLLTGTNEGHGVGPASDCGKSALNEFMLSADVDAAPEVCTTDEATAALRALHKLGARSALRR